MIGGPGTLIAIGALVLAALAAIGAAWIVVRDIVALIDDTDSEDLTP